MTSILENLDWRQFELLCGSLLVAEGYSIVAHFGTSGTADQGVDWIVDSPDGRRWVVQTKRFRRGLYSPSLLRRVIGDLQRGMALYAVDKGLLMLSVPLTPSLHESLGDVKNIHLWDAPFLESLLVKHPSVRATFLTVANAEKQIDSLLWAPTPTASDSAVADRLIARLEDVKPGRRGATQYEQVCVDILSYSFSPYLRVPKIQKRSEDGLDRRDAIFPIESGRSRFWDDIKYSFSSRVVVAEFKNYAKEIGQKEVESLQQYLFFKARRAFGLLCSRLNASRPAVRARRRAWMLSDSLILFLSDGDLKEIIRKKQAEEDPTMVLDAQMDEFFLELAP